MALCLAGVNVDVVDAVIVGGVSVAVERTQVYVAAELEVVGPRRSRGEHASLHVELLHARCGVDVEHRVAVRGRTTEPRLVERERVLGVEERAVGDESAHGLPVHLPVDGEVLLQLDRRAACVVVVVVLRDAGVVHLVEFQPHAGIVGRGERLQDLGVGVHDGVGGALLQSCVSRRGERLSLADERRQRERPCHVGYGDVLGVFVDGDDTLVAHRRVERSDGRRGVWRRVVGLQRLHPCRERLQLRKQSFDERIICSRTAVHVLVGEFHQHDVVLIPHIPLGRLHSPIEGVRLEVGVLEVKVCAGVGADLQFVLIIVVPQVAQLPFGGCLRIVAPYTDRESLPRQLVLYRLHAAT